MLLLLRDSSSVRSCEKEYSDARLEFSPRTKMKEQEEACVFIVLSLFFVAFQSKIRGKYLTSEIILLVKMSSTRHKDALVWTLVFNEKTVLKNNKKRGHLLETDEDITTQYTQPMLCVTLHYVWWNSVTVWVWSSLPVSLFSFAKFTYDKIVNWFLQKYLDFQLFAWRRCI